MSGQATRWNEIKQILRDDLPHKWDNRLGKDACIGYIQKWLRKSEQGDKWNRCLIEGMIVLSETGARDEQTTPP